MPCGCGGANRGAVGCSCDGPQAHGTYGASYGDTRTTVTYSSSVRTTNGNLTSTATAQKVEMQGLNNRLAGHMQELRNMCQSGSAAVDPAKYHEMMRMLEAEICKLRGMYEDELNKLRRQLQDATQQASSFANSANSNRGAIGDLQAKLQAESTRARRAEDELNNLHRLLAGKDKEIADLTAALKALNIELDRLRPDGNRLARENDDLRRQLELEKKARLEAEAQARGMGEKIRFDGKAFGEQQKDLNDRIRVANEIIVTLEAKLKQLSNDRDGNLPSMLQRLRDGTVAEMRKFQRETEDALSKNLTGLKRQMDEEASLRDRLAREKAGVEDSARRLQARCSALEGEIQALRSENAALKQALEQEKARCAAHTRELEGRLRDSQMQVMSKVKEFATARDAQGSLNTEINQYRGLLDIGSETMRTCHQNQSSSSINAYSSPRIATPAERPATAMDPPAYSQVSSSVTTRTYGAPKYGVSRVSHNYQNPPGCPPPTNCAGANLPAISKSMTFGSYGTGPGARQASTPYGTTYGFSYNKKYSWK